MATATGRRNRADAHASLPNYYVAHYRQADAVLSEIDTGLGTL
jgi:hypothetical protein